MFTIFDVIVKPEIVVAFITFDVKIFVTLPLSIFMVQPTNVLERTHDVKFPAQLVIVLVTVRLTREEKPVKI